MSHFRVQRETGRISEHPNSKKAAGYFPAAFGVCRNQHPHPQLLPQPLLQPMPVKPLPQKSSRRMIRQQLSPQPPLPPQLLPQLLPQQVSRRMIQMMLLHPLLLFVSHPHPQFVAAKSLISFPPK